MRAAIGFKPRIGRAVMVTVAGTPSQPVIIESREIPLLPAGAFAPYHVASELPKAKQQAHIDRTVAVAHKMAEEAVREAAKRCRDAGHEPAGCGVLVGNGMPGWSTEEIIAVHVRMHVAEGELFRDVLVAGARANKVRLVTLPDKTALESAAKELKMKPAQLDAALAALGKSAGPPWQKFQREAAAAALAALA